MPIRLSQTLKKLLIIYVVVFILTIFTEKFGLNLKAIFALIPTAVLQGKIWQLFTYSFLHVDVMHLVLNLLVLAFVGSDVESLWGTRKFLSFYFFCTVMAGLCYLLMQLVIANPLYFSTPMLGASGGIYGLLLAYGILFPDREMLFMMLLPMKAKHFVWVLAGVEFLQILSSGQGGLGSIAHLSGMGAGYLFLWFQVKGFQFKKGATQAQRKRGASHLRLVKNDPKDDDDKRGPKTWH